MADKGKHFRFGNIDHRCDGVLHVCLPIADDLVVMYDAYVVPTDVTLLFGIDGLWKLLINFRDGTLPSEHDDWSMKMSYGMGNLYAEWPPEAYYTELELQRIHRHWFNPTTDKLILLIHHGAPKQANPGLCKQPQHVRETCDVLQILPKEPGSFQVAIPNDDCVFNRAVGMENVKIDKMPILQGVYQDTKLSIAVFLDKQSSEKV